MNSEQGTVKGTANVSSHRDLVVWQKAMDLAELVYRLSSAFPRKEQYGLTSQLTRAVASVPANIAEGCARRSTKEYAQFVSIAKGSLMEAETFLILATRVDYIGASQTSPAFALISEVSKMLTSLRTRLEAR